MYGDSAGLPELRRAVPQRIGLTDHYGMRCQIGYGRRAYRRDRPALLICRGKAARARCAASWMVSLARLMQPCRPRPNRFPMWLSFETSRRRCLSRSLSPCDNVRLVGCGARA